MIIIHDNIAMFLIQENHFYSVLFFLNFNFVLLWQILKPNLAYESTRFTEADNLWIGPRQVSEQS